MSHATEQISKDLDLSKATVMRSLTLFRQCRFISCGSYGNRCVHLAFTKLGELVLDDLRGERCTK